MSLSLRGALATHARRNVPGGKAVAQDRPPLSPCARTPRPSAFPPGGAGTPARVAGSAHTGGSVAAGAPPSGTPRARGAPAASHPRPAPLRSREAGGSQGAGTASRSMINRFCPQPRSPARVPGEDHRPGGAARRPLPRRAGVRSLHRMPAAPVPQPGRL